jgi:hypothetical protein
MIKFKKIVFLAFSILFCIFSSLSSASHAASAIAFATFLLLAFAALTKALTL